MKFPDSLILIDEIGGRAPQGARGLKFPDGWEDMQFVTVAPRKGRVG